MSKKCEIWEVGVEPCPTWVKDQRDWAVWEDTNGEAWFQSIGVGNDTTAVIVGKGELVVRSDLGVWTFNGLEVSPWVG